jgi:hypothetical protein
MISTIYRRLNGAAYAAAVLSLVIVCSGGRAAAQSTSSEVASSSERPGLPYAIADFDGDLKPDVAAVEGGRGSAAVADYSIRLNLSGSGSLSIPLIAPAGGLSVEARDVNGDHAPDLIVATMWQRKPVAVFLNNGHGGFSRASTSEYKSSFDTPDLPSASRPSRENDAVATLAPESAAYCALLRAVSDCVPDAGRTSGSTSFVVAYTVLTAHSGRAPPSSVFSI